MADTSSPAPAAPPPAASSAPSGATVHVRVPWPTTSFEHGIDGLPEITGQPTEVPQSALAQILEAARKAGLELIVEEDK